ncbi:VUT family protein [Niabella hibiscisoli]|uniref:VUT family protein n=1 Tax=Niabella hibiscisoli TaxID=1825928 RepID=UPI001F0EE7B8|nr:VUT family protein [Niabella hibiscisoli]MCH5717212.1 VUT family protein [Niabella hibiscisoli]
MIRTIINDKPTKLFILLGGFFIANAIIAEVIGVKLFSLEKTIGIEPFNLSILGNSFSFNLTAGVLLWPVVFIMTDIINEYYGVKGVRFLSFLAAALIAYTFIMFQGAIGLTPADFGLATIKTSKLITPTKPTGLSWDRARGSLLAR